MGATESPAYILIETKVVFTWNGSSAWSVRAARSTTVDVERVTVTILPELCCGTTRCMSTDIYVVHWQTLTVTNIRYDIKVAELTSEVISVTNRSYFGQSPQHYVKAAGCSPVC